MLYVKVGVRSTSSGIARPSITRAHYGNSLLPLKRHVTKPMTNCDTKTGHDRTVGDDKKGGKARAVCGKLRLSGAPAER